MGDAVRAPDVAHASVLYHLYCITGKQGMGDCDVDRGGTRGQQQAGRSTLIRQHPVRKDQVTTTGRQAWRIRFARRALGLLY